MWIFNSDFSKHITGDKTLISHFIKKADPTITFEDDNKGYTMGYDKLEVGNVIIDNIGLVEGLMHKLLNVTQFTDSGFKVN